MRDMFYNYEYHINAKSYQENPFFNKQDTLEYNNNTRTLFNAKGDELGICAKMNSKFTLFFNFVGFDQAEDVWATVQASELHFDILDFRGNLITSVDPSLHINEGLITVELTASEDGPLVYGIYKMHLYIITDKEETLTIFSDRDGLLSIE